MPARYAGGDGWKTISTIGHERRRTRLAADRSGICTLQMDNQPPIPTVQMIKRNLGHLSETKTPTSFLN
jgi:hypothetical protein